AEISCISEYLLSKFNLQVQKRDGVLQMANSSITIPRLGTTEPVIIRAGKIETVAQLEVLSDIKYPGILIGEDLVDQLQFNIRGLPHRFPDRQSTTHEPAEINNVPPLSEPSNPSPEAILPQQVRDAIKANEEILPSGPCPLPEAIIQLKSPDGASSFRRQY